MSSKALTVATLVLMTPVSLQAEVVGRHEAALPLTNARLQPLPSAEREAWTAYLEASEMLMNADKAALRAERAGLDALPPAPAKGPSGGGGMPLDRDPAWYGTIDARRVADTIISFQTPAGGWSKNQDRSGPRRLRGQGYVPGVKPGSEEKNWNYVGTLDNNATWNELAFLARVQAQVPGPEGARYRLALLRGVDYLLKSQYPSGGWPQIFPLVGGYHDAITYNDDAFAKAAALLADVARGEGDYAFAPRAVRDDARDAVAEAVRVVLDSQVIVGGQRTVWGQQHDPLTLEPVAARLFEPVALSAAESGGLLLLLMDQPGPSPELNSAVHDGIAWLRAHAIADREWAKAEDGSGRTLIAKPGAPLLWARFYDVATGRPIFGDRDGTVHDDVEGISAERREGYSWFNRMPQRALDRYDAWSKQHPAE